MERSKQGEAFYNHYTRIQIIKLYILTTDLGNAYKGIVVLNPGTWMFMLDREATKSSLYIKKNSVTLYSSLCTWRWSTHNIASSH